ncbi:EF-hand domain-containing protein [Dechloromonas sp. ZY10]|uniref:EF-hand domain-containing protein n=1 Tax=Dechloromonas aquae TaxID=2664436 RepID=UPI0035294B0C
MINGIGHQNSMASRMFARLDTKQQGYLEKTDLANAFSKIGNSSSDTSSSGIDDVFAALDGDSDGKVSENEFSSALSKLRDELDSQFGQMRMQQAMAGQGVSGQRPPPPPGGGQDGGFSKDQLSSQLEEIGNSDSQRSSLISSIVDNFDQADSNGDGKVNHDEAMAYGETLTQGNAKATGDSTATSTSGSEAAVMQKIMQLIHAYSHGAPNDNSSSQASQLSVSA